MVIILLSRIKKVFFLSFFGKIQTMSGHSKWATIKRQKEANDHKRGQIFSKLARAISIAAKEGGGDPQGNFKLRLLLEKARQANMPKDNIQRAIKKGQGGEGGEAWEEILYEGYGPEKIAILVETVTDNRNRTTAEIKSIFDRAGGALASPGAVSFQFRRMSFISIAKKEDVDGQLLSLMDLGVEDVEETRDGIEIYAKPEEMNSLKSRLEEMGQEIIEAELFWRPNAPVEIAQKEKAEKILRFIETLEDHDDVQKVYSNFDASPETLGQPDA